MLGYAYSSGERKKLQVAIISLYGDDGDDGYYSHVGKLRGYQPLSLESKCEDENGNAITEIGHALGL
ncbi:hypothetical protein ANCCAN_14228 [Ancylostoma caninum]|uniref:Peptidase M12A domain-containing protein n=1 Tax=Ancylostoma caninum TaxID=29170 RepID=A0A368G5X6_ANCCA|nr:hypothetical protein ANCCAN_14228 [Ancylostoma caninum]